MVPSRALAKQGDYGEDEDDPYGEQDAEGGLTASEDANGAGGATRAGGGEVDLLSMDELTVNDAPRAVPAVGPVGVGANPGIGGVVDLFGGGSGASGVGVPQPQPSPKQVVEACPSRLGVGCFIGLSVTSPSIVIYA